MDYKQFMHLMESGDEPTKESIHALQEFVKEFPYFQTAHALLARSMYVQQHVRFEKQLKVASAYAGDRKVLYSLIHPNDSRLFAETSVAENSPFIESQPIPEEQETENVFAIPESEAIPPEKTEDKNILVCNPPRPEEDFFFFKQKDNEFNEEFYNKLAALTAQEETEISKEDKREEPEEDIEELPSSDPHEIIRRRLNEILGLHADKKDVAPEPPPEIPTDEVKDSILIDEKPAEEKQVFENVSSLPVAEPLSENTAQEIKEADDNTDLIEKIVRESENAVDDIQRGELEYALEATIIQSLEKLPVIEKVKPTAQKSAEENSFEEKKPQTFFDWLKIKSGNGYGRVEEVHAYSEKQETAKAINTEDGQGHKQDEFRAEKPDKATALIDRFIEAEPKIIPSKTEFYSPASQAKKSVTENEDLVSETLAKIYLQQGHLVRARQSYQKLSLIYPEKLAYFAALISEIDKEINNQDKQDL